MNQATKLYRVHKPQRFELMPLSTLAGALFASERARRPKSRAHPTAEWYCQNEDCPIREVEITAKYLDEEPPAKPPAMKCPRCRKALKFHGYVESITLLPHDAPEPVVLNVRRADG